MGVYFRNLPHVRSEAELAPRDVVPGADDRPRARLTDIVALRGGRLVLVEDARVDDAAGRWVRSSRDHFGILRLELEQGQAPCAQGLRSTARARCARHGAAVLAATSPEPL